MRDEHYCGFVCGDVMDEQEHILDEIRKFGNYNPEFALVMLGKLSSRIDACTKELQQRVPLTSPPSLEDSHRKSL